MSSGDPKLDTLLANLNAASAIYAQAVDFALADLDRTALDQTIPAVRAASDALAAYTIPSPPLPPPPPAGPLQLTTPLFTRSGTAVIVTCRCSSDVNNATLDHPLGTKIAADSGKPAGNVLTFSKSLSGGPLNIAAGTVVSIRGWSTGPTFKPTNVLTLTV